MCYLGIDIYIYFLLASLPCFIVHDVTIELDHYVIICRFKLFISCTFPNPQVKNFATELLNKSGFLMCEVMEENGLYLLNSCIPGNCFYIFLDSHVNVLPTVLLMTKIQK